MMTENGPKIEDINGSRITIKVPLENYTREVAREAGREGAKEIMDEFKRTRAETCPISKMVLKNSRLILALVMFLAGLGVLNIWSMLR